MSIQVQLLDSCPFYRAGFASALHEPGRLDVVDHDHIRTSYFADIQWSAKSAVLIGSTRKIGEYHSFQEAFSDKSNSRVIVIAQSTDHEQLSKLINSGVSGLVERDTTADDLVRAIFSVQSGHHYIAPRLAGSIFVKDAAGTRPSNPFAKLTWREARILELLAEGLSNKEIGLRLSLREKTIKHYLTIILEKLAVRNRVQAAILATGGQVSDGRLAEPAPLH